MYSTKYTHTFLIFWIASLSFIKSIHSTPHVNDSPTQLITINSTATDQSPIFLNRWRKIERPSINLRYPEKYEDIAQLIINYCEAALDILTPIYGYSISQKIEVSVLDQGDSPNGFATSIGQPRVALYLVPPPLDGSLHHYRDWLRLLILHEFAHIFQLEPVSGITRAINYLLGRTLVPNHFQPSFVIEGMAVWIESKLTGRGRAESALVQGFLRALTQTQSLPTLDELLHRVARYPGPSLWYLAGGAFFTWLIDQIGSEWIGQYHKAVGNTVHPFRINPLFQSLTGLTLSDWLTHWHHDQMTLIQEQSSTHFDTPTPLFPSTQTITSPRVDPDGNLWIWMGGALNTPGIYRISVEELNQLRTTQPSISPPSALTNPDLQRIDHIAGQLMIPVNHPVHFDLCLDDVDSKTIQGIIWSQIGLTEDGRYRNDLWWSQADGQSDPVRITNGQRLREPRCIQGGHWALAIQPHLERTRLVLVSLDNPSVTQVIFQGGVLSQIGQPTTRWMLSNQLPPIIDRDIFELAQSKVLTWVAPFLGAQGEGLLISMPTLTHSKAWLFPTQGVPLHPYFSSDGQWLYYSLARNKTYDIYRVSWPNLFPVEQVTHLFTGALNPIIHQGKLIFSWVGADGLGLGELDLHSSNTFTSHPITEEATVIQSYDFIPTELPKLTVRSTTESPWLPPLYWTPLGMLSSNNIGGQLGLAVSAIDLSNESSLSASLSTELESSSISWTINYVHWLNKPQLHINAAQWIRDYPQDQRSISAGQLLEERYTTFNIGIKSPLIHQGQPLSIAINYQMNWMTPLTVLDAPINPLNTPNQYVPTYRPNLSVSMGWGRLNKPTWSQQATDGFTGFLSLFYADQSIGSSFESLELSYTGRWAKRLGKKITIATKHYLRAGLSGRNRPYRLNAPELQDPIWEALWSRSSGGLFLRGYPSHALSGTSIQLLNITVRKTLWTPYSGIEAAPYFLSSIGMGLWTEIGCAGSQITRTCDTDLPSVGVESYLKGFLFWSQPLALRLGYGKGIRSSGIDQVYFFAGPFW